MDSFILDLMLNETIVIYPMEATAVTSVINDEHPVLSPLCDWINTLHMNDSDSNTNSLPRNDLRSQNNLGDWNVEEPVALSYYNNPTATRAELFSRTIQPTTSNDTHWYINDCIMRGLKADHYDTIETGIYLMEEQLLTEFPYTCRGLVCYPDLLERFLTVHRKKQVVVSETDIKCMLARCVEEGLVASAKILLDYCTAHYSNISIKLLPRKYIITESVYQLLNDYGIYDPYYDVALEGSQLTYTHLDIVTAQQSGIRIGYRDVYHALLYGSSQHLQAIIISWDIWHQQRIMQATYDYFGANYDVPHNVIIEYINKRCLAPNNTIA